MRSRTASSPVTLLARPTHGRPWWWIGLLALAACGDPVPPPAPGRPAEPPAPVLQRLETGGRTWSLSIGSCVKDQCPVVVNLVDGGRPVDSVQLRVPAATQTATEEKVARSWGVAPATVAWQTGEENSYVGTALIPVSLPGGFQGVLAVQNYGFEHVKRSHLLLRAVDGKIDKTWEYDDPPGPSWSVAEVSPSGLVIWRMRGGEASETDQLRIASLAWNATEQKVIETALPGADEAIQFVVAGRYPSIPRARAARGSSGGCLDDYLVLDAAQFPGLGRGIVVAAGASSAGDAEATLQALQSCQPGAKATIAAVKRGR